MPKTNYDTIIERLVAEKNWLKKNEPNPNDYIFTDGINDFAINKAQQSALDQAISIVKQIKEENEA